MPEPSRSFHDDALRVDVDHRGQVAVVRLAGSANMDDSAGLKEELFELIDSPVERLVLDMTELDFLGSVGLGAIIAAHLQCRHANCSVHLVGPRPKVRELLQVTRLDKVFFIHESLDQALATA